MSSSQKSDSQFNSSQYTLIILHRASKLTPNGRLTDLETCKINTIYNNLTKGTYSIQLHNTNYEKTCPFPTQTHTCTLSLSLTYTHTHKTQVHTPSHNHTHMHTHTHTHTHTHIHTHTHTDTHTHTHTHYFINCTSQLDQRSTHWD